MKIINKAIEQQQQQQYKKSRNLAFDSRSRKKHLSMIVLKVTRTYIMKYLLCHQRTVQRVNAQDIQMIAKVVCNYFSIDTRCLIKDGRKNNNNNNNKSIHNE